MIWLTTIGIWLCGLGALACAIISALLLRQNRRATQVLTAQLNSLGDTHVMGFEALTMDRARRGAGGAMSDEAREAMELAKAISPMLAGRSPEVQGAALADLLAMWLAGHVMHGDPRATRKARKSMLKMHLVAVEQLIDIDCKMHVEPEIKRTMQ